MHDLNEMAIFAKVVETGSFTEAARKLGFPKSTISRKISKLEERLGVLLLQRTTRKLKLTDTGSAYYTHCARIVEEVEEADQIAAQKQAVPAGLIRVAGVPGMVGISDLIGDFSKQYEQVQFELKLETRRMNMLEEGIDIAFRVGTLNDSSLIARCLGKSQMILCASPEYLKRKGTPKTIRDLKYHSIITGIPWSFVNNEEKINVSFPIRLAVNENRVARQLALKGLGITVLAATTCMEDIQKEALIPIFLDYPLAIKNLYMLYPSNRYLTIRIRSFIDFVMKKWGENPPMEMMGSVSANPPY